MPECTAIDQWVQTGEICIVGYGSAGDTGARNDAIPGCKKGTIDIGNPQVDEPTETIRPRYADDYPRAKSIRDIILDHHYCTRLGFTYSSSAIQSTDKDFLTGIRQGWWPSTLTTSRSRSARMRVSVVAPKPASLIKA